MLERFTFYSVHVRTGLQRNLVRLLTPLLIAVLLLISVALPILPAQRFVIYLPLLVAAAVVGMALIRWPELGLVALIVASIVIPFEIGTGTGTSINATVIILALLSGLWILRLVTMGQEVRVRMHRTFLPLGAFIIIAVLAFVSGQLPWFSFAQQQAPLPAQLGGLIIFVFSFAAFILVALQVRDMRWLQWLVWVFLALFALFIMGWLVPGVGQYTSQAFQRGATSNSLFWTWSVALALGQAIFNNRLQRKWRIALLLLTGATLYVAYFIGGDWKSGWIPPMVVIGTLLILRSWRFGIVFAIVALLFSTQFFNQLIASDEYSYSTRIDAWLIMLEIIKVSPILGFGPANYYWYTPLFPIRGYFVEFSSHNQYVDLVAQVGILGLACFLWFFAEIGALGWRLRNRVPDGFARAYVYSALGGLVGTLVAAMLADWVLPFVYNIGLNGMRGSVIAWIFLGGLVALEQITKQQQPSSI